MGRGGPGREGREGGEEAGKKWRGEETEGEGRKGAGGKEGVPGASRGFESRLASVPSSYLRALGSLPRPSGWESPPTPPPEGRARRPQ